MLDYTELGSGQNWIMVYLYITQLEHHTEVNT